MLDQLMILDSAEQTAVVLSNTLENACPIREFRQIQEAMDGGAYNDNCRLTVPATHADAVYVADGNYVLFMDPDGNWQEYKLMKPERVVNASENLIIADGEHSFYELAGEWIDDIRPENTSAGAAASQALTGTRWQLGTADDLGTNSTRIYKTSVLAGLCAIAKQWGGELRFRLSVTGGVLSGRYVDILTRRGADTGKRFEIFKDMTSISQIVDRTFLFTALVGRGKGVEVDGGSDTTDPAYGRRLEFTDVVWSAAGGDPCDKPAGQNWIGDAAAAAAYGPAGRHIRSTITFDDCTDADELLHKTYDALQLCKVPRVTYKMSVITLEELTGRAHEAVRFGDTNYVINNSVMPAVTGSARVILIDRNHVDPRDCRVTLGNYLPSLAISQTTMQLTQQAMQDRQGIWDRADAFTPASGAGGSIELLLDLLRVQLSSTVSGVSTDVNGNLIIENPEQTKALKLGAGIFAIANTKSSGEYVWRAFGTGDGFVASMIVTGILKSANNLSWIDMDDGTFNFANMIMFDGTTLTLNPAAVRVAIGQIGGQNLLKNSTGLFDTDGWTYTNELGTGTLYISDNLGFRTFMMTPPSVGSTNRAYSPYVSVQAGKKYTICLYGYQVTGCYVMIQNLNDTAFTYFNLIEGANKFTFTAPAGSTSLRLIVHQTSTSTAWFYFGKIMFYEGETEITWAPCPSELKSSSMEMTDNYIKMRTKQFLLELLNTTGDVGLSIDSTTLGLKIIGTYAAQPAEILLASALIKWKWKNVDGLKLYPGGMEFHDSANSGKIGGWFGIGNYGAAGARIELLADSTEATTGIALLCGDEEGYPTDRIVIYPQTAIPSGSGIIDILANTRSIARLENQIAAGDGYDAQGLVCGVESGESNRCGGLSFTGTFYEYPDTTARRCADIIAGFSTGVWGTEFLSFRVGGCGDSALLATERLKLSASQAYFVNGVNVSAQSFTDRTPYFEGDALTELGKIKGKDGSIDHNSLPIFMQSKTKREIKEIRRVKTRRQKMKKIERTIHMEKVDIVDGKAISHLAKDTETVNVPVYEEFDLFDKSGAPVFKQVKGPDGKEQNVPRKYRVPVMEEIEEDQEVIVGEEEVVERDLGAGISMLIVGMQQLTNLVEQLTKRVEQLEAKKTKT